MILLKWRVFKLVLLLAIAVTVPSISRAQTAMNEIVLSSAARAEVLKARRSERWKAIWAVVA